MTEKLCIYCRHSHRNSVGDFWCRRPIKNKTNLITGQIETKINWNTCEIERTSPYEDMCGKEGKYFESPKSFWEELSNWVTNCL